jgi:hypothetical protein
LAGDFCSVTPAIIFEVMKPIAKIVLPDRDHVRDAELNACRDRNWHHSVPWDFEKGVPE